MKEKLQKDEDQEEILKDNNEKNFNYLKHYLKSFETQLKKDKLQDIEKLDKEQIKKLVEELIAQTQANMIEKNNEYDRKKQDSIEKYNELKNQQKEQLNILNLNKKELEKITNDVKQKEKYYFDK